MKREQVLLKPETIESIEKEAEKQGISKSAIMRQIVEKRYDFCKINMEGLLISNGFSVGCFSMGEYEVETFSKDEFHYSKASFGDESFKINDVEVSRFEFIKAVFS